jgi:hypothetical protein
VVFALVMITSWIRQHSPVRCARESLGVTLPPVRTNILVLVCSLALALAAACGDDDDGSSDAGKQDSGSSGDGGTHHDAGGADGGGAKMDAATGGDSGGDDHGGSGGMHAIDSGIDADMSDDDAGSMPDAGFDAGIDSGVDSGNACTVMCNGKCCAAHQVCGTVQPKTVDVGWGFGTGQTVLHVVQGSTVTFSNLGTHNVNQFPNETAFMNCDFTDLTPLATTGTYEFHADTLGDFYFGCSISTHCANNAVKKHIIVDTPGMACMAQ